MRLPLFLLLAACSENYNWRGFAAGMANTPTRDSSDYCTNTERCRWEGSNYVCRDGCNNTTKTCRRVNDTMECTHHLQ
jgi:hypothetical protein